MGSDLTEEDEAEADAEEEEEDDGDVDDVAPPAWTPCCNWPWLWSDTKNTSILPLWLLRLIMKRLASPDADA